MEETQDTEVGRLDLEENLRHAKERADFCNDVLTHDIRNYAQTIRGYLETLISGTLGEVPEKQLRVLRVCHRQSHRIGWLIDQVNVLLLVVDQCPTCNQASLGPIPLESVIPMAVNEVLSAYADRRVESRLRLPEKSAVAACPKFHHVLHNLVSNAIAHNPSDAPRLWVTVTPCALGDLPAWSVAVADNGPGVPKKMLPRLLSEPVSFSRTGSGIGLPMIKTLLRRCGGQLRYEDRVAGHPEQGACFVAEIPAAGDAP